MHHFLLHLEKSVKWNVIPIKFLNFLTVRNLFEVSSEIFFLSLTYGKKRREAWEKKSGKHKNRFNKMILSTEKPLGK